MTTLSQCAVTELLLVALDLQIAVEREDGWVAELSSEENLAKFSVRVDLSGLDLGASSSHTALRQPTREDKQEYYYLGIHLLVNRWGVKTMYRPRYKSGCHRLKGIVRIGT